MKGSIMKRKIFCFLPALAALAFLLLPALAFAEGLEVPGITPADFGAAAASVPEAHWIWTLLGSSLAASLLAAAGKIVQSLIASVKDARIARACRFVQDAVTVTYQEYVRVVKEKSADGKLTVAEKNEALQRAYRKAVEIARTEGFDLLKVLGKDAVMALIERFVGQAKAPSAVKAALAPLPALPELTPSGS
jgi:hypothetical protein